jgi:hypothetical protein
MSSERSVPDRTAFHSPGFEGVEGGGLYCIRFSDKHYYGGRARSFRSRWETHLKELLAGKHGNAYLQNVFDRHGRFEPEVLSLTESLEEQVRLEQAWLDENWGCTGCLNLNRWASGGNSGHSSETREKIGASRRGKPTPATVRKKISRIQRGRLLIRRGDQFKRIRKGEEPQFLGDGWAKESPFEGTRWVHRSGESLRVKPEDLPARLEEGWSLGREHRPTLGTVCVHLGSERRRILKEQLPDFLASGWVLGWPMAEKLKWIRDSAGKERRIPVSQEIPPGWSPGRRTRGKDPA